MNRELSTENMHNLEVLLENVSMNADQRVCRIADFYAHSIHIKHNSNQLFRGVVFLVCNTLL